MKKMKTVFVIDRAVHRATDVVQEQWVTDGEGIATLKWDGSSCLIEGGRLFKRYDAKPGRTIPAGFMPCEDEPDAVTGHHPGWVPVEEGDRACKYHLEAFDASLPDGTYELLGPKVQGNKYGFERHRLVRHGADAVEVERTLEGIIAWLRTHEHEGLVFHHPDGRLAKVRRKDFGIRW